MSKTRWRYWDHRAWTLDANGLRTNFAAISKSELSRAYKAGMSAGAYQLWLYLQHEISGRTSQKNPDGWILGSQQIQRETGLSRASVYRAIKQLKEAGLINTGEGPHHMKCWLSIPADEARMNHPIVENHCGKPPTKSQNCDSAAALESSQKRRTATPQISDIKVSDLSQDPRSNLITRSTRGGEHPGESPIAKRKGGIQIPTELISLLYSKICEDTEEHRDLILAWQEHPDRHADQLASKSIAMRYGPPQSMLQLMGWKGTHRKTDIKLAMEAAIEWSRGVYKGF